MKTNYLVSSAIFSIVLTITLNFLIIQWNLKCFNESSWGNEYRKSKVESTKQMNAISEHPSYNSVQELKNVKTELHAAGDFNMNNWFSENTTSVYLKFLIPILGFILFNISLLNYKYAETHKASAMVKTALKNPYYTIITILFLLSLISNVIFCKSILLM